MLGRVGDTDTISWGTWETQLGKQVTGLGSGINDGRDVTDSMAVGVSVWVDGVVIRLMAG